MSKSAIVLRGFQYKPDYVNQGSAPRTYDVDWRLTLDNYVENLFTAFPQDDIDLYMVSYPVSEEYAEVMERRLEELLNANFFVRIISHFLDPVTSSQVSTFKKAFEVIEPDQDYNQILVTRFDCVWKMPFNQLEYDTTAFNFLWREYENMWKDHHRVGDPLHVFAGEMLEEVRSSVLTYKGPSDTMRFYTDKDGRRIFISDETMHYLWEHMAETLGVSFLSFLFDGYFDSNPENTSEDGQRHPNPLFYLWRGEYRDDL